MDTRNKVQQHKARRMPILGQRLRELQGDCSTTAFSATVNIARQTWTAYTEGSRVPDGETLAHISRTCGVSTDYLLGLTDVKSSDLHERQICEYTGLSLQSVRTLHNAQNALLNENSEEVSRKIQAIVEAERIDCAKKQKELNTLISKAEYIFQMSDKDFSHFGMELVSEVFQEYYDDIEFSDTSKEKVREAILNHIELLSEQYEFTEEMARMLTDHETDLLRGDAELMQDGVNHLLSSEDGIAVIRKIALIILASDGDAWMEAAAKTTHGLYTEFVPRSKLAITSLFLEIEKILLEQREKSDKKYTLYFG